VLLLPLFHMLSLPLETAIQELLQHGSFPCAAVLQELLQRGSFLQGTVQLLRCGVLQRLQVDLCSAVDLHGLQGHCLPHRGLLHGLQGNICSGIWSTFSSFKNFIWVSAELYLAVLTPLSHSCHEVFFSLC